MPEVEIGDVAKSLKGAFGNALNDAMLSAAYRIQQLIVSEIIPETQPTPVDRGFYRAAWRVRSGVEYGEMFSEVVNDVKHALFIEYGVRAENVRPGKAMHDALTDWVIRKGLAAGRQVMSDGSSRKKNAASVRLDASSMAYAIMLSMTKNGIFDHGTGLKIAKRARAHVNGIVTSEIAAALKAQINRI